VEVAKGQFESIESDKAGADPEILAVYLEFLPIQASPSSVLPVDFKPY
jgi:hypothetical protein